MGGKCIKPKDRTKEQRDLAKANKQKKLGKGTDNCENALMKCGKEACVKRVLCASPCICDSYKSGKACKGFETMPKDAARCSEILASALIEQSSGVNGNGSSTSGGSLMEERMMIKHGSS